MSERCRYTSLFVCHFLEDLLRKEILFLSLRWEDISGQKEQAVFQVRVDIVLYHLLQSDIYELHPLHFISMITIAFFPFITKKFFFNFLVGHCKSISKQGVLTQSPDKKVLGKIQNNTNSKYKWAKTSKTSVADAVFANKIKISLNSTT